VLLKHLSIIDDHGIDNVLLCEKCYKEFLPRISIATEADHGVAVIISDAKQSDCAQCKHKETNELNATGPLAKIWRHHTKPTQ